MQIALALLAQAAIGATPLDVDVPNAIVGLHNRYVRCQDQNFDPRHVRDSASFRAEVERAIHACASQKTALERQAETVLAALPEYADAPRRQRAIREAFDGYDRTRRLMARARPR
ncbi:MAG TPA: hypothetical protein VMS43_07810 [Allosphingosinicella sp.]|nr:hypothetical protein [Allosphingosinicella sp.]